MPDTEPDGLKWQTEVWKRMSSLYADEWDERFAPIVRAIIDRGKLAHGDSVLDLGSGTGSVAMRALDAVGPRGSVVGVDLSEEMVAVARERVADRGLDNLTFRQGRGESIPASDQSFDVVLSSLTLMYVIDRAAAAKEIARVLRPGGRLIAAVWAGPGECDIVRFQQAAGSFGDSPPVPGVGPGALADPTPLIKQLADAGIGASFESEVFEFEFSDFRSAWDAMAGVTTSELSADRQREAQSAVLELMYEDGDRARRFRNLTHFISAQT
ncbi:MAG: class I SAM-dependent methyltransferase [Dehalococcoidia bacterium]|jgi:SAM-dependent methyltransferase|nr:class I SAM-dependent methyltransferase [Dehalococcoidia bacterium]